MFLPCTGRYPNIGLQNGIAIFYEILGFIGQNTRRYPPSRQVLTACLQILGQVCIVRIFVYDKDVPLPV